MRTFTFTLTLATLMGLFAPASVAITPVDSLESSLESSSEQSSENSAISEELQQTSEQGRSPQESAYDRYREVINRTVSMIHDASAQALAEAHGLNILNITWEDTGRYHNSAVGPNISDMTIQVQQHNPVTDDYHLHLMPVIRTPNFTDETADIPIDQFFLTVGNARGEDLEAVSLQDVLANVRRYLSNPDSWTSRQNSFLADRDTHVLVSAQACFLPIPEGGRAAFNPVLFNYQSYPGDPAVLTLLATREGTSITVIDNQRDGFDAGATWGQRLFFNQNGERASLTGQRLSDFTEEDAGNTGERDRETDSSAVSLPSAAGEEGLNMVMLIQVPLRQKEPMQVSQGISPLSDFSMSAEMATPSRSSNVEAAVIGHGAVEGPFTEIDGLDIERDPDFPIRVTVQFYKATNNGVVSEDDIQEIQAQIARVYEDADYVGSLVVDGLTGRPTEYEGPHDEPEGWWDAFWRRYEEATERSREEALDLWRRLTQDDRP
jgi:hypothetical protein